MRSEKSSLDKVNNIASQQTKRIFEIQHICTRTSYTKSPKSQSKHPWTKNNEYIRLRKIHDATHFYGGSNRKSGYGSFNKEGQWSNVYRNSTFEKKRKQTKGANYKCIQYSAAEGDVPDHHTLSQYPSKVGHKKSPIIVAWPFDHLSPRCLIDYWQRKFPNNWKMQSQLRRMGSWRRKAQ